MMILLFIMTTSTGSTKETWFFLAFLKRTLDEDNPKLMRANVKIKMEISRYIPFFKYLVMVIIINTIWVLKSYLII